MAEACPVVIKSFPLSRQDPPRATSSERISAPIVSARMSEIFVPEGGRPSIFEKKGPKVFPKDEEQERNEQVTSNVVTLG